MGKVKRLFVCGSCERPSAQWSGRCASCGEWGTVSEHPAGSALRLASRSGGAAPKVLTLAPEPEERRIRTGFASIDRVLGGGLVPGSVILLAGAPGIGKSTLLLQLGSRLAGAGHPCLLASGEEARSQVAARARRLGLRGEGVGFVPGRDLAEVLASARSHGPAVLIVDSIHTIRDVETDALPGGVGQVRACADALIELAKGSDMVILLIGHVTKGGDLAGPKTLEHAVDVVLTFDGDQRSGRRILAGGKNRFGPEGEVAWFEMTAGGLAETEAGPRIGQADSEAGCATALTVAGRRGFAIDVQALVVPSDGPPRRQAVGLDPRRFHIVAAVTDQVIAGLRLGRSEVFGAAAGGFRTEDPGTDLAVAAALASAGRRRPLPPVAFVGELSLTGAIRPVAGMEQRLAAAAAAGFRTVVVPGDGGTSPERWSNRSGAGSDGIRLRGVGHLGDALAWAFAGKAVAPGAKLSGAALQHAP